MSKEEFQSWGRVSNVRFEPCFTFQIGVLTSSGFIQAASGSQICASNRGWGFGFRFQSWISSHAWVAGHHLGEGGGGPSSGGPGALRCSGRLSVHRDRPQLRLSTQPRNSMVLYASQAFKTNEKPHRGHLGHKSSRGLD